MGAGGARLSPGAPPDHEPYRAWSNLEFIDDEGRVNEVDALVLSPAGLIVVEIKSRPGTLQGDPHTWTWTTDGRQISDDNPLLLANRKAKRLASVLVTRTGRTSITLDVEVWVLRQGQGERLKVTEAEFTFVAVGEDGRPRELASPVAPAFSKKARQSGASR